MLGVPQAWGKGQGESYTLFQTLPEREKEIAKQCEFTDYVVKPIDIKELKKLIAKVLA